MKRFVYSCFACCMLPLAWLHLWRRSRRQPEYLQHVGERFGHYPQRADQAPLIWIHAVSVGETHAAEPLITALHKTYPGHRILLTHMTPTGRATNSPVLARCERRYLPYDTPGGVRRFLRHYQPVIGFIMETELWPNLIAGCHARKIPLLLINARLSEKSARRYARLPGLTRQALGQLHAIVAQTDIDAGRLSALGAPHVSVMGNLKFDRVESTELSALGRSWKASADRPVIVAASTRDGEEILLLSAFKREKIHALLVIVPRHPQRFASVAALAGTQNLAAVCRSGALPDRDTQVWIGDSMGEMPAYYAMADIVIMGGSLLDYGSQNLIEACAAGAPVLLGPSTYNFAEAATQALLCGAALQVDNAQAALTQAGKLLQNPPKREAMAQTALQFARSHHGATQRVLDLIAPLLPPPSPQKSI